MNNPYYNGLVTFSFSISIECDDHQTCLAISKKIKDYLSAWSFNCSYPTEYKGARKGDVLLREIQGRCEDYPSNVIAFREGLRCICYHYNLHTRNGSVELNDHGTSPKDSRLNIIQK